VWDAQSSRLLTGPLQHGGSVNSAQFSPDGKRIVTASADGTARVWDAQSGLALTEPLQHGSNVWSAQFSPDGKRIITTSGEGTNRTVRVWDSQTGQPLTALQRGANVNTVQFSPDGHRMVTTSDDGTVQVCDAESGQPLTEPLKHEGRVDSAQFSLDGKRIVTASAEGTARVWDAQTGQPLTEPLQTGAEVSDAEFSPDGKRILTTSRDGIARVWDISPAPANHPAWLAEIAEVIAGKVLNNQGVLERTRLSLGTLLQIRQRLDHEPESDDWVQWGRWFLADPATRTISPFSKMTVTEYIENLITENTDESLAEAEMLALCNTDLSERIARARRILLLHTEAEADPAWLKEQAAWSARSGSWKEAAMDFFRTVELDPNDYTSYHALAPLLVQSGDFDGYRQHCARALARFRGTNDPDVARQLVRDCLLLPSSGVDLAEVGKLAQTAVAMCPTNDQNLSSFQFTAGLADYRQGQFSSAVEWMQKATKASGSYNDTGDVELWMVLAMAQYHLQQTNQAHSSLARGMAIAETKLPKLESGDIGDGWINWICAHVLMKEAKKLIEGQTAQNQRKAVVRSAIGTVERLAGSQWQPLASRTELGPGAVIRTGSDSVAYLSVNGLASSIRLHGDSLLLLQTMESDGPLSRADTKTVLYLKRGSLLGQVRKLSAKSRYEIQTPNNGMMAIRGTDFEITAAPGFDGGCQVTFTSVQGEVTCSAVVNGNTVTKILRTGESWTPSPF
jgi:Flp pilus assembly protein TadD